MNLKTFQTMKRQNGFTLMEMLVAGVISLFAVTAMVITMGNTLGTGSQTIEMTRLSQELRASMQILTRELRRANYHATYLTCYGNVDCLDTLGITSKVSNIHVTNSGDTDCMWFWYDRPQSGTQIAISNESVAGFRLVKRTISGRSTGIFQMTTTETSAPDCNNDAGWSDLTDSNFVNVQKFNVCSTGSYQENIASGNYQNVQRLTISMEARLVEDDAVPTQIKNNTNATRELEETVLVRNNTSSSSSSPPTIIACT